MKLVFGKNHFGGLSLEPSQKFQKYVVSPTLGNHLFRHYCNKITFIIFSAVDNCNN